ncbi:MAG: sensor histidine kinase, partial [Microvirga sp.]|nr:sensor histidine kinase [Microvirga sp.]
MELRQAPVLWDGIDAELLLVRRLPDGDASQRLRMVETELGARDVRIHELESVLDTATDGVIVLDETGRILSLNRTAEALFGYNQGDVVGDAITVLLSPESHIVALDYLEGLRSPGVASLLNDGREVLGRVRQGGSIPLFMTMGQINDGPNRKLCAVLRDITPFKKAEGELVGARRAAEQANAQKSDLLAKISHEIRTPLNAILGFAEVMLEERFGPIGNDRYKEYLKDVHASGAHVISLVNDLLDLAKVEAGRMDLSFTSVNLNDLVSSCFTLLQPQAARDRIVMRTSFAAKLPPVVADDRSVRQIVLNLVSNAIKFTDAGGQVIVSTALTDRGEVAFRVRDTGIGMNSEEVEAALEPFRQLATSRKRGGTGLGLPLTKALVEANRGALQISSQPNEGTLVEVIFPPTRVL